MINLKKNCLFLPLKAEAQTNVDINKTVVGNLILIPVERITIMTSSMYCRGCVL